MRRRAFVKLLLGGVGAAWPLAAPPVVRAQPAAVPVVGFLGAPSPGPYARYVAAIVRGLKETGHVEGRNLRFEYRWAEGDYERLPALAADLVKQRVGVIVAIGGAPAAAAAKAASTMIPIVFTIGADPVQFGLVASLNRPGGNITGIAMLGVELEAKRLQLLLELVPAAKLVAFLVNPKNAQADIQVQQVEEAARAVGKRIAVVRASTQRELEAVFAAVSQERADALLVGADTYFASEPVSFVVLTARHAIPAIYPWRSHVDAGGLMSYGTDLLDAYRQTGVYTGRILNGEKPADLPVMQATRFELVINLKTARAIDLAIPATLLARADEVVE
ncbi:MAG: ABC transporter substrate-binding protein [Proteobacteria bacterium]|nr:MAG: ABC transporter substrate-binding protein [Pseudomonadota bacterium]